MAPSDWVTRWAAALPAGTRVLDLACGSGRHARWLAGRGLRVTAVDRDWATLQALDGVDGIEVLAADLEQGPWPLCGRRWDAVVVTHYLWRERMPQLLETLAPGGLLVYETFNVDQARIGKPSNPQFLLRHGELLAVCAGLHVLAYEDGALCDAPGRVLRHVQRIAAWRAADGAAPPALSAPGAPQPL